MDTLNRRRALALNDAGPIRSRSRQRGITTLGFLILAVFVGLFAFAAIQLTPVYLNYLKVAGVVSGVQQEFDGQNPGLADIRRSIERRFDVESVSKLTAKDVKVTPKGAGFEIDASYDHTTPFIANISFTVHFSETAMVRR